MKNIAIKENHLYQKAYRQGRRAVGKTVAVYVLRDYAAKRLKKENPEKQFVNRIGLSVSKKIGSAVERNRAKRIIRAAYDPLKPRLRTGYLIVISAREAIHGKKSTDVQRELERAFSSLDMLTAPSGANKQTP
ncbi:MAG: ribonuclease P protein component [Ruminococcaceae bacterium]|nr:ribonuclease P protein component [Oscillospiraceae bacterium]